MTEMTNGPLHYPEPKLETPYDRAARAWERRVGSAAEQVRGWQRVTYVACGFVFVFGISTLVLALKSEPFPIIVRVGEHGGVEEVHRGIASRELAPRENEIRYFVADLVRKLRSLPLDPVVAKLNWQSSYAFLTKAAATKMSELARRENPLAQLGEQTVQVRVASVVGVGDGAGAGANSDVSSEKTYQVRWEERRYSTKGGALGSRTYTGFFTVRIQTPKTEAEIFANPLGLFVTAFEWSSDVRE